MEDEITGMIIVVGAIMIYLGAILFFMNYDGYTKWNKVGTILGIILVAIPLLKLIVWFILE